MCTAYNSTDGKHQNFPVKKATFLFYMVQFMAAAGHFYYKIAKNTHSVFTPLCIHAVISGNNDGVDLVSKWSFIMWASP